MQDTRRELKIKFKNEKESEISIESYGFIL